MNIRIAWLLGVAGCTGDKEPADTGAAAEPQSDGPDLTTPSDPDDAGAEEDPAGPATGVWRGECAGPVEDGVVFVGVRLVLDDDAGAITGTAAYAFEVDPADGPPGFGVEGTRTDDQLDLVPTGTYTTVPDQSTALPTLGFQLELDRNQLRGEVQIVGYDTITLACRLQRQ